MWFFPSALYPCLSFCLPFYVSVCLSLSLPLVLCSRAGASFANLFEVVKNFALLDAFVMLGVDTVLYLFAAWYLDRVAPTEGQARQMGRMREANHSATKQLQNVLDHYLVFFNMRNKRLLGSNISNAFYCVCGESKNTAVSTPYFLRPLFSAI